MKRILLPLFMFLGMSVMAQNSLLQSPINGSILGSTMSGIAIGSNGTDAVLFVSSATGVHAVDIADNNPADAAANTITSVPNFVALKLTPLAGQAITVMDMAVNPISKSVYILGKGTASDKFIFKVENNGANVTMLDLTNQTYSYLNWGGPSTVNALNANDMVYGDGTLYVSSGTFSLDGELGWIKPPFKHTDKIAIRSTTLFKSNWGGQYFTTAPLETLTFGTVDGKSRLMGVTTCAPGFSIDVANLSGSGLLSVTEDFNMHQGQSVKVAFMQHDGKEWLFDLHDSKIYRVGKKYLDGSQVTANKHDNNAVKLRTNAGAVVTTLPADEIKLMSNASYSSMAFWDNYRLLVLEANLSGGALKLEQMSTETPPPTSIGTIASSPKVSLYPNPATNSITITLPKNETSATATIVSIDGRVVATQQLSSNSSVLNVNELNAGVYTVNIAFANGSVASNKLTIE